MYFWVKTAFGPSFLTVILTISMFAVSCLSALSMDTEVLAKKVLIHSCLLKCYLAKRLSVETNTEYLALIQLTPNDPALHFEYGNFLARLSKPALAVTQFRAAAKLQPSVPEYQVGLGNALMYTKNYDLAVAAYTKACNLGGKYQQLLQTAQQYQAQSKALTQYTQKVKQQQSDEEE